MQAALSSSTYPSNKVCKQLANWAFTRPCVTGCKRQAHPSKSLDELKAAVVADEHGGCEACAIEAVPCLMYTVQVILGMLRSAC